jgi:hypothetical protein
MGDLLGVFKSLVDQWGSFLVARLCQVSSTPLANLGPKIPNSPQTPFFPQGYEIAQAYPPEQIALMNKSAELLLSQFHRHNLFPQLFSDLIATADTIFSSPLSDITKGKADKALHTKQIVKTEVLNDVDKLCCDVFEYLARILSQAGDCPNVDFNQIQLDSVTIIFKYVEHFYPNAVRASAGTIVSSLSASAKHAQMICDMFWRQFAACKKDDEFRNFATWIDGIEHVKLSLETPELAKTALDFLGNFVQSAKKMERGVLRMKFLAALLAILSRLCKFATADSNQDLHALISKIWDAVMKWSAKQKITTYCCQFLGRLMVNVFPAFFCSHAGQFFELMYKSAAKSEKDATLLQVILEVFTGVPKEYYEAQFPEFKANVDRGLIPLLFKTGDKIKRPRFSTPEQATLVVKIMVQVGLKHLLPVIDFVRLIFNDPAQAQNKAGRLVCVQILAELSKAIPDEIMTFNDELFAFMQPILLKTAANPGELEHAVVTFPLLHPHDQMVLEQISRVLFDLSMGELPELAAVAFSSLRKYIEALITLERNALAPLNYMNNLLQLLPTLPKKAIIDRLGYVRDILQSYAIAMGTDLAKIDDIKLGNLLLTAEDWVTFRTNLDKVMLPLLFYPDAEVAQLAEAIEAQALAESIVKLDRNSLPEPHVYLANVLEGQKDNLEMVNVLQEQNPRVVQGLFESTLELWRTNVSRFDETYTSRIATLLAVLARPNHPSLSIFFEELFKVLRDKPTDSGAIHCISAMVPRLWILLLDQLNNWMTTVGLTISNFWTQFTSIYLGIASRAKFKEAMIAEPKLVEAFERYISGLWKTPHANEADGFVTCEKSLKVLSLYVKDSPDHFSRIVETTSFGQFLDVFQNMIEYEHIGRFPATFLETFLTGLTTIFEYADEVQGEVFGAFVRWLVTFRKTFKDNDTVQVLLVRMLTMLLSHNPRLLRPFFRCTFTEDGQFASKFLLAMANVYVRREIDFEDEFPDGNGVLLCAILLHLRNDHPISRQAAHKLMCLMVSRQRNVFTSEVPTALMMSLTSHSPAGYITQAAHFVGFVSKSITAELAGQVFATFAADLKWVRLPQQPLLSFLVALVPLMVKGRKVEESANFLLSLTVQAHLQEATTAEEIHKLWSCALSVIAPESVNDLIQVVFRFTLAQSSLRSAEGFVGVIALTFIFEKYPREIASLLVPILCTYDRTIPQNCKAFLKFLEVAEVDFTVQPQEVIALNALSQILLLIQDNELFNELFVGKLAQLVFFAVIMFDNDAFAIGPFHPLLDTLLDAALFRFASDHSSFTKNLQQLQASNLVLRANSLDVQYQILTSFSESKHILAYDQTAVQSLSTLLSQSDAEFGHKFFIIVLSTAFKVKDCERGLEPFLVLMALTNQLTTQWIYHLLLFAVFSFTNNRTELVDSLVEIIRQRLVSDTLDPDTFALEVVPVIVVFILYLSLDCRRALSMHIVRILADVCHKVGTLESKASISSELNKFLARYQGDEYVASLFLRFLGDLVTFGDQSVTDMVRGLYELAMVMGAATTEYNWCMVLALIADGLRFFIGEKCGRPQQPALKLEGLVWGEADAFMEFVSEKFKDLRQRLFIVQFLGCCLKKFKCIDRFRDSTAMMLIFWFLKKSGFAMDPVLTDNVIKLALLEGFAEEAGVKEAARVLAFLIAKLGHVLPLEAVSVEAIKPVFVETTCKPIGHWQAFSKTIVDRANLPNFTPFAMIGVSTSDIVSTLYDYINHLQT